MIQNPENRRRAILLAGLSTVVFTGTCLYFSPRKASAPLPTATAQTKTTFAGLPQGDARGEGPASELSDAEQKDLWAAFENVRREINALTPEEAALPDNEGLSHFSYLPSQDLTARYGKEGVTFARGRDAEMKVGFEYDDGGAPSEFTASGTRAEFHHGDGVVEWFDNGAAGIEHGFTLSQRPASSGADTIELEVALSGLEARGTADPDVLELGPEGGDSQLRYSTLKAWDADGSPLLARMEPTEKGIRFHVDDRSARYPVTIDPLITTIEQKLLPLVTGAGDPNEYFGSSVAIDGDTAVIGARLDATAAGSATGSAYIFNYDGTSWTFGSVLAPFAANTNSLFGSEVDIEGDTVVVSAPGFGTNNQGAVFVFTRSGGAWSQEARVQPDDSMANHRFGSRLSLSGETFLASVDTRPHACYFFNRTGTTWLQQQRIQPTGDEIYSFGYALALEGNTAMIATERYFLPSGAFVYFRSGNTWSFSSVLENPGTANPSAPPSIALQGNRAVLGFQDDRVNGVASGAAYVFTRNLSGIWGSPVTLTPSPVIPGEGFGRLVRMDGDTIVIGQPGADLSGAVNTGAMAVFSFQNNTWTEGPKLFPHVPQASLTFGQTFAIDGGHIIAGTPNTITTSGIVSGKAEAYTLTNGVGTWQSYIDPGDSSAGEHFGKAVAVEDDTAVIGAPDDYTPVYSQRGSVYVLTRESGNWSRQAKLTVNDIAFGQSVALSGDTLLAGALRGNELAGLGSGGQAWAFVRNGTNWTMQDLLLPDEGVPEDDFSFSMAIDGDRAVIGSPGRGSRHGSAFVFERSGGLWYQQAKLEENPRRALANFGSSVDVDGTTILIGAPEAGLHPGCAYVYSGSGTSWTPQTRLDGDGDFRFGASVSLSGNLAIVGAPESNAAHIFAGSGDAWTRMVRLTPDDATLKDFGQAVSIDGYAALVGANEINPAQQSAGEAFLFARDHAVWSLQGRLDGGATVSGARALDLSGDLAIIGSSDEGVLNPFNGLTTAETGAARIYRITGELVNSPEARLIAAFDEDDNGSLSPAEWRNLYVTPPAEAKEKLFAKADTDANGQVSITELSAAGTAKATAKVVGRWISRAGVFSEVDANDNGEITRTEIIAMWPPATPAKTIDAFWSRAKAGSGLDLVAWVKTKTLPSFPTYTNAKATRAKRLAAAETIDADDNGIVTRTEFAVLLGTTKEKAIDTAWKAATATPKDGVAPASITIAQFVESPKLPALPNP
ncbi:hypothetical protein [Luteolibacter luteus]|uniref:EF-hand domain-containing protein n=1 Tax=Luteolibacter luteus TaxID=2728835 RepID=A0A858RQN8_9BACT|nr:hypothetical protein [Luteolibacter luteus]QJE98844.1 hypothetical protein HHL09_24710 [Luteolibacter luteus]